MVIPAAPHLSYNGHRCGWINTGSASWYLEMSSAIFDQIFFTKIWMRIYDILCIKKMIKNHRYDHLPENMHNIVVSHVPADGVALLDTRTFASTVMANFTLTHWGWDKIDAILQRNENAWIPIKIPLKFVPKGPINNIPALVQIMAWRRTGDKPLSEPMVTQLNDAYLRHSASIS